MLFRKQVINIALALASLVLVFVVGELTVRYLQSNKWLPNYAKNPVTKEQKKINANNPRLIPSENPKLYVEFDPEDPRLNKAGMRGEVFPVDKPAKTIRIAVIGDSVGFGFGLPVENSFPFMLDRILQQHSNKNIEVINFSVTGYGLESYIEVYDKKVKSYEPDMVLMTYILNDLTPPSDIFAIIRDVMKGGAQIRKLAKTSQFAAWLVVSWNELRNSMRASRSFTGMYEDEETPRKIADYLAVLKTNVEADQAHFMIFVFPYFMEFDDYPFADIHHTVGSAAVAAGVEAHDLLGEYQALDATTLQLQAGDITHPNAEGNRIAAEAIARTVMASDWWKQHQ